MQCSSLFCSGRRRWWQRVSLGAVRSCREETEAVNARFDHVFAADAPRCPSFVRSQRALGPPSRARCTWSANQEVQTHHRAVLFRIVDCFLAASNRSWGPGQRARLLPPPHINHHGESYCKQQRPSNDHADPVALRAGKNCSARPSLRRKQAGSESGLLARTRTRAAAAKRVTKSGPRPPPQRSARLRATYTKDAKFRRDRRPPKKGIL